MDAPIATNALPIGTRVERYVVQAVLGAGGFGITYLAEHELLKKSFAVKEHFPKQFAARDSANGNLIPTDVATYKWSGRIVARSAVGEGFPFPLFRFAGRGHSLTMALGSTIPPKIPQGGFSPLRLQSWPVRWGLP